jgi:hypothetical protein
LTLSSLVKLNSSEQNSKVRQKKILNRRLSF